MVYYIKFFLKITMYTIIYNNMNKNIIVTPNCFTCGDTLSAIGLIYFLLHHYENVYLHLDLYGGVPYIIYFEHFFSKCEYYNKRLFLLFRNDIIDIIKINKYDHFHMCCIYDIVDNHENNLYNLFDSNFVNSEHYFNTINPLYNFLEIDEKYICSPNVHHHFESLEINHLVYYKMLGLNNTVRMDFFNYTRDIEKEVMIKNEILNRYNIKDDEKYNIINTACKCPDITKLKKYIDNDYPCIDINFLVDFPGWLFLLIENAESIHLLEGCNTNLLYHSQYKKIIDIKKTVNVHIWLHNRHWLGWNCDYAYKMYETPKLDNWNIILNE